MPKITIIQGLPASGKSTIAKQIVDSTGNTKRINKDDMRAMFDNSKWSKNNEKFILKARDLLIESALENNFCVVVDDTNFHPKHIETIKEIAKKYKAQVEVKFIDTPIDECIKRDLIRPNSVGEKVIRDMYNTYLAPKISYQEDDSLEHVTIVDIDGTIAKLGDRSPYEWSKVNVDTPNQHVCDIVSALLLSTHRIIFVSGRDEICREDTEKWIIDNFEEYYHTDRPLTIYMRKNKDMRPDTEVKKEIFENNIKGKYYVDMVIDDRPSVCRAWRSLGLQVVQVADPDVEF